LPAAHSRPFVLVPGRVTRSTSSNRASLPQPVITPVPEPRPKPKPGALSRDEDSDDGFNIRRNRERARSMASSEEGNSFLGAREPKDLHVPTVHDPLPMYMGLDMLDSEVGPVMRPSSPSDIAYRLTYPDGGGRRWVDMPPQPGNPTAADRQTEMQDPITNLWIPIPQGFSASGLSDEDVRECWQAEVAKRIEAKKLAKSASKAIAEDPDESDLSGSDWGKQRDAQERVRAKEKLRGKIVRDTESEDDEDDRDLEPSAVPETRVPAGTVHRQSTKKTRPGKGKQLDGKPSDPALDKLLQSIPITLTGRKLCDACDAGTHARLAATEEGGGGRKQSGLEEHYTNLFGDVITNTARAMGLYFGRSQATIMTNAGLKMTAARGPNSANDFRTWFSLQDENKGLGREF
jgi:hypothetical protein